MIRYEPHPAWFRDILHFPVSYALRRALYGTLAMGAYAFALATILSAFMDIEIPHSGAAVSIAGAVITFGLAFRLDNAYARWWEGRMHWGMLVNHSRNLAALVHAMWPANDADGRRRMAGLLGDFGVGLAQHLRGELDTAELESLTPQERTHAAGRRHALAYLGHLVWRELEQRRAAGTLDTAQVLLLQPHAGGLLDVAGACERIRNTPIPFAVTVATRVFLLAFLLVVPLGLHEEFGYGTIAISMAAFFALAVMDVLSAELENPFGIDCNDLPTRSIGEAIRRDVHEILEVVRDGAPDREPVQPRLFAKIR